MYIVQAFTMIAPFHLGCPYSIPISLPCQWTKCIYDVLSLFSSSGLVTEYCSASWIASFLQRIHHNDPPGEHAHPAGVGDRSALLGREPDDIFAHLQRDAHVIGGDDEVPSASLAGS